MTFRVGIGGWVYAPWRGVFYPPGLPHKEELAYASRQVTAIEINGTFYRLQNAATYRRWHDETPADFVFSLKGPRYVTHRKDLGEAGPALERFFASGLDELGDKLGPILWQFAPAIALDEGAFAAFLNLLPQALGNRPLRHVVELPRTSPTMIDALHRRRVAIALIDDAKRPLIEAATADFAYARLRRCEADEPAGYPPAALDAWAERARHWATQGDAFLYFINGAKHRAPAAAAALLARLGN